MWEVAVAVHAHVHAVHEGGIQSRPLIGGRVCVVGVGCPQGLEAVLVFSVRFAMRPG